MKIGPYEKRVIKNLKAKKTKITADTARKLLETCFTDREIKTVLDHMEVHKDALYSHRNCYSTWSSDIVYRTGDATHSYGAWYPLNKNGIRKDHKVLKDFEKEVKKRLKDKFNCEDANLTFHAKVYQSWGQSTKIHAIGFSLKGTTRIILDEHVKQKQEARGWLNQLRSERKRIDSDIALLEEVIDD